MIDKDLTYCIHSGLRFELARKMLPPTLPLELLDAVLLVCPDKVAFKFSVGLRRLHVRDRFIPRLPAATPKKACQHGRVELLQWWWARHGKLLRQPLVFDECMKLAAKHGKVSVLDWFHDNLDVSSYIETHGAVVLEVAAHTGRKEVFEWWIKKGLPNEEVDVIDIASTEGHVELLDYISQNFVNPPYTFSSIYFACKQGHVDCLEWWEKGVLKLPQPWLMIGSVLSDQVVRSWWDRNYGSRLNI